MEFSYCTITFGANPNYSIEEFYKVSRPLNSCLIVTHAAWFIKYVNKMLILFMLQEQLPEDLLRVDLLFRKAHESGVIIQVNPVPPNLCACSCVVENFWLFSFFVPLAIFEIWFLVQSVCYFGIKFNEPLCFCSADQLVSMRFLVCYCLGTISPLH